MQRALSSALLELEKKTTNYRKAATMLRTYMGIEVRKSSSSTEGVAVRVITLTRVDDADPERPFHIQYSSDDHQLKLMKTKPSIGDLTDLQEALAAGGDLGACIAQIRARFRLVVRQQAARRQRRAAARSAGPAGQPQPAVVT
ncbi:uncharacterized protein LOC119110368 [Pollicipes pollicipes]|uniref:uncharacterized protein LOC119110368 n=1 Tax=Pollicipes pollicipes TaxID=41117 RepID=UPI0018852523|nr:uncharacterized protein LOC119110368 [Pollicipes pollicipes]